MNATALKIGNLLKNTLKWLALTVIPLFIVFVIGEQIESARLGAVAACETAKDQPNCMRQRGYLAASPFYPDITRRVIGGYAKLLGGALGATYAPLPPPTEEDSK